MSEEKKVITINPDYLKIPDKKTKKKPVDTKLRVKREPKTQTLKNRIMKLIRENQAAENKPVHTEEPANSDFEESFKYLEKIVDKVVVPPATNMNATIKRSTPIYVPPYSAPMSSPSALLSSPFPIIADENVGLEFPSEVMHLNPPKYSFPNFDQTPKFGCMKGGTLPTYRTQRNHNYSNYSMPPPPALHSGGIPSVQAGIQAGPPAAQQTISVGQPHIVGGESSAIVPTNSWKDAIKIQEQIKHLTREKMAETQNPQKKKHQLKYLKQKKIFRKTFCVGKSRSQPKLGVLISNKTLRNRVSHTMHEISQTPIQDVRRYLVKKGFIKVGTAAPNDVLRKMYESVRLFCGEVQNHNSENVLYNFMNSKD
jgi:hypothetical protein